MLHRERTMYSEVHVAKSDNLEDQPAIPSPLPPQVQSGGAASDGGGANRKSKGGGGKGAKKGNKKRSGGGGGKGGAGKNKKETPTAGLLELRRTPESPAVLVGRNNLQNERITFSLARAHEVWLHARGVAGAHVLLRLVGFWLGERGQKAGI